MASEVVASKGVYGTPSSSCGCVGFVPQLYRPALCAMCFKSIAEHFEEWSVVPETKPPTYMNRETGETMGARANEAAVARYHAALQQKSRSPSAASSRDLLRGVAHNAISELNSKLAQQSDDVVDGAARRSSVGQGALAPSIVHAATPDDLPERTETAVPSGHSTASSDAGAPEAPMAVQLAVQPAQFSAPASEEAPQPIGVEEAPPRVPTTSPMEEAPPHVPTTSPMEEAPPHVPTTEADIAPLLLSVLQEQAPAQLPEYSSPPAPEAAPETPATATATATVSPELVAVPTSAAQPPVAPPAAQPQVAQVKPKPSSHRVVQAAAAKPPPLPQGEAAALMWLQENTPPVSQLLSRRKGADGAPWMQRQLPPLPAGTDVVHTPDRCALFSLQQALAEDATGTIKPGAGLVQRVLRVGPHTVSALAAPELHPQLGFLQWERTLHSLKYVGVQSYASLERKGAVQRLRSLSGAASAGAAAGAAAAVASGAVTAQPSSSAGDTGVADCVVLCFGAEAPGLQFLTSAGSAAAPPPSVVEGVAVRSGSLRKKKKHSEGSWKAAASGVLGAMSRPRRGSITKGGGEGLGYGWKERCATLHAGELLYFASQAAQATAQQLLQQGGELMGRASSEADMAEASKLLADAAGMTQGRILLNGTVDVTPYFPESEPAQFELEQPVTAAFRVQTATTHHYLQVETPAQGSEWISSVLACTHTAARRLPLQVHVLKCRSPEQAQAVAAAVSAAQRALPPAAALAGVRLAQRLAWELSPSYDKLMQLDVQHARVLELAEVAQVAPSTALRLLHSTGGQSGIIRQASSRDGALVGRDGQYVAERIQWQYIDDFDDLQGPFYEAQMRSWVQQGWFKDSTMARCVTPVLGVDYSATAAASGGQAGRTMLMAVGDLFPDGMRTAFDGSGSWISAYNLSAQYQRLVVAAMGLGLPPSRVMAGLQLMRSNTLPPDLGLLMDLMPQAAEGGASA